MKKIISDSIGEFLFNCPSDIRDKEREHSAEQNSPVNCFVRGENGSTRESEVSRLRRTALIFTKIYEL